MILNNIVPFALEQEPALTLISTSNFSFISGMQQAAYLTKAESFLHQCQFLIQAIFTQGSKTPHLFACSHLSTVHELGPDMPAINQADRRE